MVKVQNDGNDGSRSIKLQHLPITKTDNYLDQPIVGSLSKRLKVSIYFKLVVQKYPTSKSYGNRGPPEAHTLIMHKSLSTRWDPASHPWCQNPGLLVNLPKKCESTLLWVVGWVLIVDASPNKNRLTRLKGQVSRLHSLFVGAGNTSPSLAAR